MLNNTLMKVGRFCMTSVHQRNVSIILERNSCAVLRSQFCCHYNHWRRSTQQGYLLRASQDSVINADYSIRAATQESLHTSSTGYSFPKADVEASSPADIQLKGLLQKLHKEYEQVIQQASMSDWRKQLMSASDIKEADLELLLERLEAYHQKMCDIAELNKIITDSGVSDEEMTRMAREDVAHLQEHLYQLDSEICDLVTSDDVDDSNDIVLELTAGVGGHEAMFFTKEMFEMYVQYAAFKGWAAEVVSVEEADLGGVRHATISITGNGVYGTMKFEGGVHRVQRVPKTERSGRVHTSTMTVAVLPQPKEIDIYLDAKDLKVETCRASGKGGQHVNTTDSAVRIVHLPTGVSAECQTGRSQIKNRETALKILSSRLYEREHEKSVKQLGMSRKLQVGSASRNEKIRTYNAKDDRITDHRLKDNIYDLDRFLLGTESLDGLTDALQAESCREQIVERLQFITECLQRLNRSR